jgi:CRISPR-associated protein Cas1
MKRLLNTLYVMTQGAYLTRDSETIVVRQDSEIKLRIPVQTLGGVVCVGNVACSSAVFGLCAEAGVGLSFLTENGRFLGRVQGPVSGNVLLRRAQYRAADEEEKSIGIVRPLLLAKIANCRISLLRAAREQIDPQQASCLQEGARHLLSALNAAERAGSVDLLRGIEGDAAKAYFGAFDSLIVGDKQNFVFKGRSRRPPLDNVNAMLSFVYTLLVHDVASALECVGLDPAVGFLHKDRPGRPSLALDLMEELRPVLADRLVLSLINRKQISVSDLTRPEGGGVFLNDNGRKAVIVAWQKRKQEELEHPFSEEQICWGQVCHMQALLLARYLRGDLDAYPAFFWR